MEAAATQTPYIINTGGGGIGKPLIIVGGAAALIYFGNKAWKEYQKNKGEQNMDTPAGQIAMQLKVVFDETFVNDEDFRRVYLQVNNTNKDDVFKQYKLLTQRNLSDDMTRIKNGVIAKVVKTEAINNKKDGIIKISATEDIQFLVAKGSKVVFTDPSKAVTLFASPKGLLWNLTATEYRPAIAEMDKIKATVINRKDALVVDAVMILPYNGAKFSKDWTKYFMPVVKTRKVFAIVRIGIKAKDNTTKYLWVDARELSKYTAPKLKGLGNVSQLAF